MIENTLSAVACAFETPLNEVEPEPDFVTGTSFIPNTKAPEPVFKGSMFPPVEA